MSDLPLDPEELFSPEERRAEAAALDALARQRRRAEIECADLPVG